MATGSVSGSAGSTATTSAVTQTDKNIQTLTKMEKSTSASMDKEFNKLDNPNLKESDKQKILWNIQQMQSLIERINAMISNMLESSHRTMMQIVQKLGS